MRTFITNTIVTGFGLDQVRVAVSVRNERPVSAARHLQAGPAAVPNPKDSGHKHRVTAMRGSATQVEYDSTRLACRSWRALPARLRVLATA